MVYLFALEAERLLPHHQGVVGEADGLLLGRLVGFLVGIWVGSNVGSTTRFGVVPTVVGTKKRTRCNMMICVQ